MIRRIHSGSVFIAMLCLIGMTGPLRAQWSGNPTVNTAVCTAANSQMNSAAVSDGAGGVITAWYDQRNASGPSVYAQRVSSAGVPLWATNGIAADSVASGQTAPAMISDGHGGAILAWTDSRNGGLNPDIYAQWVSASGNLLWGKAAAAVCSAIGMQMSVQILGDGVGGAILVWEDMRGGLSKPLLYAQRVDSTGVAKWSADGVVLCGVVANHYGRAIMSDGANGAIVVWEDSRNGFGDIFAQHINGSGVLQWTADGVPICLAENYQITPQVCTDMAGGAFITWADHRAPFMYNIYAQRVNASGTPQWTTDGIGICTAAGGQSDPLIVANSVGNAIIAWSDGRSSTNSTDVYAQRINLSGTSLWTADGLLICGEPNPQDVTCLATDGLGGVMLTWDDTRTLGVGNPDIYGQRLTLSGSAVWAANGVPISTATGTQQGSHFVPYGSDGAIVVWDDYRQALNNPDIYCTHVNADGTLTGVRENAQQGGGIPQAFLLNQNYPNPFNPVTTITYVLPEGGLPAGQAGENGRGGEKVRLSVFDLLGREVAVLVDEQKQSGTYAVRFDGGRLSSGVYVYRLSAGTNVASRKMIVMK